jgi:hypothetical protein
MGEGEDIEKIGKTKGENKENKRERERKTKKENGEGKNELIEYLRFY